MARSSGKSGGRKPNGASTVYKGKDGKWHGRVTVGVKDDGTPDRRHVERRTHADVLDAVRELEKQRDEGNVRQAGQKWTVEKWLRHWVEEIAPLGVRESTIDGYGVAVRVHLIPGLGAHRLEKLKVEHLERFYKKMQDEGKKPATAHQVHRTLRVALGEAVRREYITKNPAKIAKAPRLDEEEIEPYSVEEIRCILGEAGKLPRNGVRWAIALALGLRQGEVLGLKWTDVDLASRTLRVRRGRLRPKYAHGCGDEPCGRQAGYCPQRVNVRKETANTKSRAGRRPIGLPPQLVVLLAEHRVRQDADRAAAGELWNDGGWVFCDEFGNALNPNTDYRAWKALIARAGLRESRLHDARHTAATVLLMLGVNDRAAMGIMGWSSTAMAKRYQHLVEPVRADIADRVDRLLWEPQGAIEAAAGELPNGN
jgi:integrase